MALAHNGPSALNTHLPASEIVPDRPPAPSFYSRSQLTSLHGHGTQGPQNHDPLRSGSWSKAAFTICGPKTFSQRSPRKARQREVSGGSSECGKNPPDGKPRRCTGHKGLPLLVHGAVKMGGNRAEKYRLAPPRQRVSSLPSAPHTCTHTGPCFVLFCFLFCFNVNFFF